MRKRLLFVVFAGLALASTIGTEAALASSPPVTSSSATPVKLWVAGAVDTPFERQILDAAGSQPNGIETAIAVVQALSGRLTTGQSADVIGPVLTKDQALVQVSTTLADLKSYRASDTRPAVAPLVAKTVAGAASPGAPASRASIAARRGSAINSNHSWTFNEEIRGGYYEFGDFIPTDDVHQRWTIDPGRTADRFNFQSSVSPNAHHFSRVYVSAYANCPNYTCGATNYPSNGQGNGIGSGTFYVGHPNEAGGSLIDEVYLQGYFAPSGQTVRDQASTGQAHCLTGSNTSCLY